MNHSRVAIITLILAAFSSAQAQEYLDIHPDQMGYYHAGLLNQSNLIGYPSFGPQQLVNWGDGVWIQYGFVWDGSRISWRPVRYYLQTFRGGFAGEQLIQLEDPTQDGVRVWLWIESWGQIDQLQRYRLFFEVPKLSLSHLQVAAGWTDNTINALPGERQY